MVGYVCPWWGGYFIDNRLRRLLHKPKKILGPYLREGMAVMDFGCGMGFFSIPMAKMVGKGGTVIAADLQAKMLQVVRKRAERAGVAQTIRTHRCDRDRIGITEPLDFVLAFWSAHEAPDLPGLFAQLHDGLVVGGRLLLAEPRGHVSTRGFGHMMDMADQVGLNVEGQPRIRLSRSATFVKR